ncbi:signal recognition particle-docking protein FtsY [bacterium]|nr:signal recognition particle-docking protein FtsY [bacterium]
MNLFKKIKSGFSKTRDKLVTSIRTAVGAGKLDEDVLEEIEEILITADLGVETSMELCERLRKRSQVKTLVGDEVLIAIQEILEDMLEENTSGRPVDTDEEDDPENEREIGDSPATPHVTFIIGVNGSGKTTSIGKLANYYSRQGEKVLIVAADTFRSAAVEQLSVWAERADVEITRGVTGADPGAVVFDGLQSAVSRGIDRVFVDTAGRLHTNVNLMRELEKLDRVAKKIVPDAPHEVYLVIDGTTGQNGISQAKRFMESLPITGLIVTKLDGTAKGGVILPIGRELKIPVKWIGLGEGMEDLVPYAPEFVVRAIFADAKLDSLVEQDINEDEYNDDEE